MRRRAASLFMVLALWGAWWSALPRGGCDRCPTRCPMHAGRIGCHHGSHAIPTGETCVRGNCGHSLGILATGERYLAPGVVPLHFALVEFSLAPDNDLLLGRDVPAPRPKPPRGALFRG